MPGYPTATKGAWNCPGKQNRRQHHRRASVRDSSSQRPLEKKAVAGSDEPLLTENPSRLGTHCLVPDEALEHCLLC